ncbi:MAG: UvrD-helicase domain-containing protein [Flavobacteriaceae bacterium]|nr:UvrD-helicase domain-containing protein [Flavobacteriaceae bacterium]
MPKDKQPPFLIYNASAGAGKTYALVRAYLFRLLSSPYPNQLQRLLAITFTNKAAQEMKDRILTQLLRFSQDTHVAKQDSMFLELADMVGISPNELHKRARNTYLYTLHHFGQLNVATIDKLTHQVIRTFARDLGINARFEVALDGKAFMAEVVDRVLSKAGEDLALTKVLVDYVLQKADELKSWDITQDISTIAEMFLNENHMQSLAALTEKPLEAFTTLDRKIEAQLNTIKNPIKDSARKIIQALDQSNISHEHFPYQLLPKLLKQLECGKWPNEPLKRTLIKHLEKRTFLKASVSPALQAAFETQLDPIVDLLSSYKQLWRQYTLLVMLRKNIIPLSLMQRIGHEVTSLQQERNSRLLGFFNKHIADTIKDTATPFIYERLGVRYQHFFVDEFQDTSKLQWSNLNPLFSHALEDGQGNGSLLLVGDAKQSIYRWRGGDPEQFMELASKKTPFSTAPEVETLPTNYRSGAEIITFNNAFFTQAAQVLPLDAQQHLYVDTCNQQANSKDGGYVTLSAIEGNNKEEQLMSYQAAVLTRVQDCISQGYNPLDICVLVRKNQQGIQMAKALTEAGIPITSSESLLISQSPEVQFLIQLVKLRLTPQNKQHQYAVLEKIALEKEDPFTWTLSQAKRPFKEVLASLTNNKFDFDVFQQLTLYAALEYAIWAFALTGELTAHIQAFLDEVLKLQAKKEATTTQLLAYWEQQKETLTVRPPDGRNAVRIMTVHKAKGLAFPVVILPFADSAWMDGNTKYAWFPLPEDAYAPFEEMLLPVSKRLMDLGAGAQQTFNTFYAQAVLDTLNTLYVGMTRPVDELHILTQFREVKDTPKSLADIFSQQFPDIQNQTITIGARNQSELAQSIPTKTKSTPWSFNASHVSNAMAINSDKTEEAQFGVLFHEVMAQITVPQDVEHALALTNAKDRIGAKGFEKLVDQVTKVVTDPKLREFFNPAHTHYCERPVLTESGTIVRPDRFVITKDNEGLLIDYKTGDYNKSHQDQLNNYASNLTKSGITIKQKMIVYTEKKHQLVEVY